MESERLLYGNWKDGIQMHFNPDFGFEWEKRMMRLNCLPSKWWECNFNQLTESEIKDVSREYGITYVVSERTDLELPLAYLNSMYQVYYVGGLRGR